MGELYHPNRDFQSSWANFEKNAGSTLWISGLGWIERARVPLEAEADTIGGGGPPAEAPDEVQRWISTLSAPAVAAGGGAICAPAPACPLRVLARIYRKRAALQWS